MLNTMQRALTVALLCVTCYLLLTACSQRAAIHVDVEKVNPWTHLDLNNDPRNFQFVIVSDRTGGERAGVFPEGIQKTNLLQPQFVMSVGDLIEGYTEDISQLDREWDEFDGFVKQLEMPFFYLAGNHDYSNPVMAEVWKQRYGRTYYHFTHQDVLFLCLNSEPAWIGGDYADQLAYIDWVIQ